MKKLFVIGVIALSVACNQVKTYEIRGTLPGAKDGITVKLMDIETYPAVTLDSGVVKNEAFHLVGKQSFAYPKYCQLVVDLTPEMKNERQKTLKAYRFFADNSEMSFHCQVDSMPSYYYEPVNKEHNVTLTGSATQALYDRYRNEVKELSRKVEKLNNDYLLSYHRPALKGIFNTAEGVKIVREMEPLRQERNEHMLRFIKENKTSVVSLLLADNYLNSNRSGVTVEQIDQIVNDFDPSLQHAPLMESLKKTAEKSRCIAKGVRFHDIELTDLNGEKVKLSEYVKPGEYNMLEFWASWCGPCRGEIPHLRHLYECGGKEHFNMISVSIDERDADWKKAVKEEHMEWHQLCDQQGRRGPVSEVYQVTGVPYCLVLDPEGKIVCGGVRGAELDVVVMDLLGDKIKGL